MTQPLRFSESDLSETENDTSVNIPPKKSRKTLKWNLIGTFPNKESAEQQLKPAKKWTFDRRYESSDNVVLEYLCRQSRTCSSKRKIVLNTANLNAAIFGTGDDHDHDEKPRRGKLLS
jgi:hypothetical protein